MIILSVAHACQSGTRGVILLEHRSSSWGTHFFRVFLRLNTSAPDMTNPMCTWWRNRFAVQVYLDEAWSSPLLEGCVLVLVQVGDLF